jgi:dTDP-4-amino-4,6-dideoxygalactose transaminase
MLTNDEALAGKLRMIANHGQKVRYYHEMVGCNSRLDAIQAAILDVKLSRLDGYNAARQRVAETYNAAFNGNPKITTPYVAPGNTHVYHQYTLILDGVDRDALNAHLAGLEIPSMIYYPVPAHRQKMFESFGSGELNLPVTDWLTHRVISLPIHTEMDDNQLEYIISNVLSFINN